MEKVLNSVLRKVTPSPAEHEKAEAMVKKVRAATDEVIRPYKLSHILAGSYTRGTYMPDKKEFDVFMMFPEDTSREKLEKMGVDLGKKIVRKLRGKHQIAYAEHPYVRSRVGQYAVDFVPCYRLKSADKIKSAVDRTPFHNQWLQSVFRPDLAPEVRLLKRFAKGIGVYGSDTRVLGLSGYLCELLIVYYGSFKSFLKECAKWEAGQVFIDPQKHHHAPEEIMPRFKGQPLILIDPVDPKRNVAAAVSPANFARLVDSCKRFLKKPSLSFFFPKPRKITLGRIEKEVRKRKTLMLGIAFRQPQVIQDVLWPQLRRAAKRLRDIMEEYEFHVVGYDVWSDPEFTKAGMSLILMEMEVWDLPNVRRIVGPPTHVKRHSESFLKKYRPLGRILVDDEGRWVAEVPRKWKQAEAKLKDSLSDSLGVLKQKGIPSYVAKSVSKDFRLLKLDGLLKLVKRKREIGQFIMEYFEKEVL